MPAPLETLINHPIAQAHGLTGRECRALLKAIRENADSEQRKRFEEWHTDSIGSPEDLCLARSNAWFTWQAAIASLLGEKE